MISTIIVCIVVEIVKGGINTMREERLQKQESMHESFTTTRIYSYNCLLWYVQMSLIYSSIDWTSAYGTACRLVPVHIGYRWGSRAAGWTKFGTAVGERSKNLIKARGNKSRAISLCSWLKKKIFVEGRAVLGLGGAEKRLFVQWESRSSRLNQ